MEIGDETVVGVIGEEIIGVFGGVITDVTLESIGLDFLRGFFTLLFVCIMNTFWRTGEVATAV